MAALVLQQSLIVPGDQIKTCSPCWLALGHMFATLPSAVPVSKMSPKHLCHRRDAKRTKRSNRSHISMRCRTHQADNHLINLGDMRAPQVQPLNIEVLRIINLNLPRGTAGQHGRGQSSLTSSSISITLLGVCKL